MPNFYGFNNYIKKNGHNLFNCIYMKTDFSSSYVTNLLLLIIAGILGLHTFSSFEPSSNCMAVDSQGKCLPPDQIHSP